MVTLEPLDACLLAIALVLTGVIAGLCVALWSFPRPPYSRRRTS